MSRSLRVAALSALLLGAAFTVASCGGSKSNPMGPGGGGGTADLVIHIKVNSSALGSGAYTPNPAVVTVGQTVQWVNDDNMTHTATANGGAFNQSVAAHGSSSLVTMSTQGSFAYHCAVAGHNMAGTVTVNP